MKKSEVVQAAKKLVRRHGDQRVCYCTPNRQMMLGLQKACMNENVGTPAQQKSLLEELTTAIGDRLRELTNRWHEREPLREFDTEDTPAAYALTDAIVDEAYDKTAMDYAERGE
jgi:hypothetical protein